MAQIKFKMPTVSRTTRLRRARNAQEDREALNRLELAERQWNIPNELRTEFTASVNNRHDTFDDHREETSQFPGLEDDSEDGEDHPRPANKWVNLEEDEVLDDIDLMVQMSNERYWQRARDFNWNILMGPLHGAYMVQKSLTDDWSGSNSYSDFQNSKPCNCGPRSKHSRYVDLVDIHWISVLKVGDPEVAADHIDEQKLTGVTRRDSVKVIRNEVNRQLLLHCELVKGWSEDVTWLWQHCQPAQNAAFLDTWNKFVDQIRKVRLGGSSNDTERTDDALEDAVLDELVDDGEDLDNADDGSVFQTNSTA
ncbi:hypothetical protein PtB15_3B505 [Puccinia triticina]|nr:hypothetical protein PtB15_3B505 [Puccinia triticina]